MNFFFSLEVCRFLTYMRLIVSLPIRLGFTLFTYAIV